MKSDKSISEQILIEISYLLKPLKQIKNAHNIFVLFRELGYKLPASNLFQNGFPGLVSDIENLISKVEVVQEAIDSENYAELLMDLMNSTKSIISLITKADGIRSKIEAELNEFPNFVNDSGITTNEFPRRLIDLLLVKYLRARHPRIFSILHLFGILEHEEFTASEQWEPVEIDQKYLIKRIQWARIPTLITDPIKIADDAYSWNTDFNGEEFIQRIAVILKAFLLPGGVYKQDNKIQKYFGRELGAEEIRMPLYQDGTWPDSYLEFDLNIFDVPEIDKDGSILKPGLGLYPAVMGEIGKDIQLGDDWILSFKVDLDLKGGIGIQLRPPTKVIMDTSLFSNPGDFSDAHVEAGILKTSSDKSLTYIFGSEGGSYLGFKEIGFNFITALDNGKEEIAAEMMINELSLKIDVSKGDGFIQKLLSGLKLESVTDLTIGISNKEGFYFRGSSALSIIIPIHKNIGPISIDTITIGVGFGEKIKVVLAASFGCELGPIIGSVERIGLEIPFSISNDNSGNFGPVQFNGIEFLPPQGAGFAISAPAITGGGFLECDHENERYSGALALQLSEIGITAIGLITTRLPDGSEGFSMLVSICVTFEPPIQIYMGFTLVGVGGLIGVNRAMKTDVLREGIKKGTLDSILFPAPASVIANASQIISDMRAVFPPEEGRFVIGPMVTLGWGTPTVITGEIGVFISIPDPVSIALMGQVEMSLPDREAEIVGIHIDLLGVLDLEKKELSFQASIFNSRLSFFKLTGDCAFLLRWGSNQEFALAIGGFHPSFTPPPPAIIFSGLKRLGATIQYGPVVELRLDGYLALTPNSLQFGSRVGVYVGVPDVDAGITGFLSFDGLIIFSPFAFEVNMGGGVTISVLGFVFGDIRIRSTLSGPTPWNIRGTATVHVLFADVNCDFGFTWGDHNPEFQEAVDVWPKLKESLECAESWGGRLPAGISMVEALRPMEFDPAAAQSGGTPELDPILVHPAGTLEVRQNVAPLELTLDKIGHAPIRDYNRFSITEIKTKDDDCLDFSPVDEYFSRGQFVNLTNQQKLSSPSFEKLPGGVTTAASNRVAFAGGRHSKVLGYESILIKSDRTTKKADNPAAATLDWSTRGRILASGNAVRRGALRNTGAAKFAVGGGGMVATQEEKYVVVNANTLIPIELDSDVDVPDYGMTRTQAEQALDQQIALHPEHAGKCMVVAEFEAEPL